MTSITEKNLLERLCADSPEFARLYREAKESSAQVSNTAPRVMVCGLLKAGKSSLLNALTGNLEQEYFETKASRATTVVAELMAQGVMYVDTPGLDATAADDEEAWRGLVSADQLIFVHNLRIAALDIKEAAFLKELLRRRPAVKRHMVVALSHVESAEDDKEARLADLRSSFGAVLGFCPTLISTSYIRHRKGTLENKPALVAHGGMAELQDSLKLLHESGAGDWLAARTVRDRERHVQMGQLMNEIITRKQDRLTVLQEKRTQQFFRLREDFSSVVKNMRERFQHYETI